MPLDPQRVETVFHQALGKGSSEERDAFLEDACGADRELRERVERLLAAHAELGELVAPPSYRGTQDDDTAAHYPPGAELGTVIAGRYKLLQTIGEGGMGAVYMAEQTEPIRRQVALKIIKPGMDSKSVLARFEAERQALALMDHPNIAKVFDAGATETGRPFFVMELVRGVPITQFCDDRQLTVHQRLELFTLLCNAVQHAHQKGIIHRDLKPSNILVESHDGTPVPKVIDFGLAKALLHLPLTDRTLFTQFGAILGTPLYMAPEQAEFNAIDVDTRADIYALGVILYELLTGVTPLERKRFAEAAWDEIRRVIKEEEPPKPSTRLTTSAELPSIAARRHVEPAALGRLVRGDLDWIVMKALAKERDRRYSTPSALAQDVQQFLRDEPVSAGPPSTTYRLRKFARRHRALVNVAVTFFVLLVAFAFVSRWQAMRATRAEQLAERERDEARQARDDAEVARKGEAAARVKAERQMENTAAVLDFLESDLLAQAVGLEAAAHGFQPDPDLKLRAAIDRAAEKISQRFAQQPTAEAAVRLAIGKAYLGLGLYPVAQLHLERAYELAKQHPQDDAQTLFGALSALCHLYSQQGEFQKVAALLDEAQPLMAALPDAERATLEKGFGALREVVRGTTTPQAKQTLAQAFDKVDALIASFPEFPGVQAAFGPVMRANRLLAEGKYAEAQEEFEKLYREEVAKGDSSVSAPLYLFALGSLDMTQGKTEQAQERLTQSRNELEGILGKDHPLLADAVGMLGKLALEQKRYDEAEELLRESLRVKQKSLPNSADLGPLQTLLGRALTGQQKFAEAETLLLEIHAAVKGPHRDRTSPVADQPGNEVDALIELYTAWGKVDEAKKWQTIRDQRSGRQGAKEIAPTIRAAPPLQTGSFPGAEQP